MFMATSLYQLAQLPSNANNGHPPQPATIQEIKDTITYR